MKCAQKWFIFPLISIPPIALLRSITRAGGGGGEGGGEERGQGWGEGREEGEKGKEGIKGRRRRLREGPLLPQVVIPPSRRREWGK